MDFLSPFLSFIVVIGILVFVHELGHFLTAKWTGMRADVFAIGMGPRLFGWNRRTGFSFGKLPEGLELGNDTDYRISAFPIGGYVRILGMIDESMDDSYTQQEPQSWEFRSKKNWQKALVLVAGVVMNLLLAIGIFWALPLINGKQDMATTTVAYVEPGSVASVAGFRDGDRIVSIDGATVSTWGEVTKGLGLEHQTAMHAVVIERQGARMEKSIAGRDIVRALASGDGVGIYPAGFDVQLGAVISYGPADKGGLQSGDRLLAMDSTPVRIPAQVQKYIRRHAGSTVVFHIARGDSTLPCSVDVGRDSVIGIELQTIYTGQMRTQTYGVGEAFSMAIGEVSSTVGLIGASVAHVVRGDVEVRQSFGGPIRIAQMASQSAEFGLEAFLRFMALISISLAVMNLLPLPGLDGGHLVFVAIESVIRREISPVVKMRFQQIGVALLLAFMAFIFYLDLTR